MVKLASETANSASETENIGRQSGLMSLFFGMAVAECGICRASGHQKTAPKLEAANHRC